MLFKYDGNILRISWNCSSPEAKFKSSDSWAAAGTAKRQARIQAMYTDRIRTLLSDRSQFASRAKVLEQFVTQFTPMSWNGSLAVILESNAKLLNELDEYPDPAVVQFVAQEKVRLGKAIETERRAETLADRERNACCFHPVRRLFQQPQRDVRKLPGSGLLDLAGNGHGNRPAGPHPNERGSIRSRPAATECRCSGQMRVVENSWVG
ncbi:MAG: hypothetical protein AUH15_10660 [Acidobacteriales bacterium 13_2_20CM_55_8]|nr:MAG: hypothetical protein AUH15_10660 [Acidobacteriales bacterium 13_2_20CM_55_8]